MKAISGVVTFAAVYMRRYNSGFNGNLPYIVRDIGRWRCGWNAIRLWIVEIPGLCTHLSTLILISFHFQIFGPVQTIIKFKTLDEAIKRANDTPYGLAAGVMTRDIDAALTSASSIRAGTFW